MKDSKFTAYVAVTAVGAAYVLSQLPFGPVTSITLGQWASLACFVAVGVLAEGMAIDFRLGPGRQAKASLAFLPFIACILLFPAAVAVSVVAVVIATSQFVLRRSDALRGIFNVAQAVISSAAAAVVYRWLSFDETASIQLHAFVGLSASFFSANILLNSCALAILRRQRVIVTLRQVAGVRGSNLWYDLLASPIALVPAALYPQYNVTGLFIIVLPLLLIRYSYLSRLQLEEANQDLLKVLVKAIETRDPYTSGHSVRVASLAKAIAVDMGLPNRQVQRIERAALLHDIGKIDTAYADVIRKPHDLSSDERQLIQTHATRGAELLEALPSVPTDVVEGVRHHHERYDGSGYPAGLGGDAIPLAARIIMLCDSVDAMLSDRPYRPALTLEETRLELIRCAGSQFDPAIVDVVLGKSTLERAVGLVQREASPSSSFTGQGMSQKAIAFAGGAA
jgi:putative nucleotidyltransferase with HDIG domain